MKLRDISRSDSLDRSRKRAALERLLAKLERTREKLEREISANGSGAGLSHLEIRLKTNRRQREKTATLIEELNCERPGRKSRAGLIGRPPLLS